MKLDRLLHAPDRVSGIMKSMLRGDIVFIAVSCNEVVVSVIDSFGKRSKARLFSVTGLLWMTSVEDKEIKVTKKLLQ